jgi:PAS domain S-box-containing protein/putative nucleotidyltransferase with HDIG domain
MNDAPFLGLVQNASLLLAAAFIFDVATIRWHTGQTLLRQVIVGLALGTIGITVMLTPVKFMAGIVFDTRSVLIGICGLFFGSFSSVIAIAMTGALRFYLGGAGTWTGISVILASGAIGITWRHFRRRSLAEISWPELYLFGMVIHLAMLAAMFTLPRAAALRVLSDIGLPVLLIYPLGTALLGVLMVNRLRREGEQEKLRRTNTFLDSIVENIPNMIFLKDAKELRFVRFNRAGEDLLGNSRDDLMGKNDYDFFPKEQADLFTKKDREVLVGNKVVDIPEEPLQTRNKGERILHTKKVPILGAEGEPEYLLGIAEDITERKKSEEALRASQLQLHEAMDLAHIVYWEFDPVAKTYIFNDPFYVFYGTTAEREGGYRVAAEDYTKRFIHPDDLPLYYQFLKDNTLRPSPESVADLEHRIIRRDGEVRHILARVRIVKDDSGRIVKRYGANQDITERMEAQENLKKTMEKLRKNLLGTIKTMSLMVEMRDPYTAGHQRRVSNLARAIAQEMGLPGDTVENIGMAGIIHDVGKMSVPAEILSKPSQLTDIEMGIIKAHSEAGYDIVKDADFPYPIAEIVLQHHEKLDGSGYPQGLKKGQILVESQIMAVADIVEAIASNRPYRAAKGVDTALGEIERNKGILYNETAVEVCVTLFREKGFTFA